MTAKKNAMETARDALTEAMDFADNQADTRDTADGPVANDAMRIAMQCREALAHITAGQQGEARPAREGLSERAFDGVSAWLRANSFVVDMAQMATMVSLAEHLLSSAAPDNNAPAPMALSSGDTLRALLREARGALFMMAGNVNVSGLYTEVIARIDAALADGGAK